ncbi:hypothetical protein HMN09_00006700 [Mycena chlorophos]|uniref:Uncharacterized protein n=1 Tax=Mycena chlorophos TaxID=658473 RepID=A0A8H6WM73_MYCCL|nr:hypothetical protein HMN09_00006700 [Mycena chlorophos]
MVFFYASLSLAFFAALLPASGRNAQTMPFNPAVSSDFYIREHRFASVWNTPSLDLTSRKAGEGMSPVWNLPLDTVLMEVHNSARYAINGSEADAEWAALIPPGGGIVHVGPDKQPFMLSMFHQLRCLDIIRKDYHAGITGARDAPSAATQHCTNYLRQMLLCRSDRRLERFVDIYALHSVAFRGTRTCRDWEAVYQTMDGLASLDEY